MLAPPRPLPGALIQAGRLVRAVPFPASDFSPRFRRRLHDRRFWIVQALVAGVTASHVIGEAVLSSNGHHLGAAYFIPASLSFFPVLYASLNFGREGAIPTAIWSSLLAVPSIIIWHTGLAQVGETFQVSLVVIMAIVVAARVDRETSAREQAEEIEEGLRASEIKYQALFDAAGEACLVLDGAGVVREANTAAADFLRQSVEQLRGSQVSNLLDGRGSELLNPSRQRPGATGEILVHGPNGAELCIQPICTVVPSEGGGMLVQVLLRDVTERRRTQDFAQEIVRAQEDERQRIAQELQDVSVQSLVVLCRCLDTVRDMAEEDLPEPVTAELQAARRWAESIADELRRFSRGLRPSILDDLGLVAAVQRLVVELSERTPVQGQVRVRGVPRRLASMVEISLFRIAQEALRNVEHHAAASRVGVMLTYGRGEVRLIVTDDGKGFDSSSPSRPASGVPFGLLGIHERAKLLGGACRIESQHGKGTRLEVRVPVTRAVARDSRKR